MASSVFLWPQSAGPPARDDSGRLYRSCGVPQSSVGWAERYRNSTPRDRSSPLPSPTISSTRRPSHTLSYNIATLNSRHRAKSFFVISKISEKSSANQIPAPTYLPGSHPLGRLQVTVRPIHHLGNLSRFQSHFSVRCSATISNCSPKFLQAVSQCHRRKPLKSANATTATSDPPHLYDTSPSSACE